MGSDSAWTFFNISTKPALDAEEIRYWKMNLNRILKAGLEFEFNLPEAKGYCRGDSHHCPCIHMDNNDCWSKCIYTKDCLEKYGEKFMATECKGPNCSEFIMACVECKKFTLDCETCLFRYDPENDPSKIRASLRRNLQPSNSYGKVSAFGVHDVVTDGSLLGGEGKEKGAEVLTTGRRVDYYEFWKMIDVIMQQALSKKAYVNERCSTHIHMLASYYGPVEKQEGHPGAGGPLGNGGENKVGNINISELEKPLPQIILSNFHQLCRKYQNAITWMCMGLADKNHMTRWEKYRVSILDTSPVHQSMPSIINKMEEKSQKRRGKYGWVNYMFTQFDKLGDITRFHVEMRALDGIMSASAVAAITCMYHALVIKAVELSRYGLLEVGSQKWMSKTISVKDRMLNNMGGWNDSRFSDTSCMTNEDFEFLTGESIDLINQLKHILLKTGPAYDVLEKLAYKPIALRRCEGKTWEEIEKELEIYLPKETQFEKELSRLIDTREVVGCKDEVEWCSQVFSSISAAEGVDVSGALLSIVKTNKSDGIYMWSNNLGTMLKV